MSRTERYFGRHSTALITGASSGIGAEYARQLASMGIDLILVARSADRLESLADSLGGEGCRVEVVPMDLTRANCGRALHKAVKALDMNVDLLVNNAGFGTVGAFHAQDPRREADEVRLNALAVVELCHAFLPDMLGAGRGAIINVASVAAFQPLPYMAVYAATKAFVLSLSQALWAEYRSRGIRVQALCPGPVDTPFFDATGNPGLRATVPRAAMMSPQRVVERSLKGLAADESVVVPGASNRALAWFGKLAPREMQAALAARLMRRGSRRD